jgi:tagatose 1,6-diphosphate aldolase
MTAKDISKLTDSEGKFAAIAVDQRGALRKLLKDSGTEENLILFKKLVSEVLTPYGSSILLDPEYGLDGANNKEEKAGLILAYEQTGYDKQVKGRMPRLVENQSVKSLKAAGADAIKLLLYFDIDEDDEINNKKEAFVERVGNECVAEEIPFLLEILTYDANMHDEKGIEFAKVRPHKVNEAMKHFSESRFNIDILKMETPVNMNFVEGYGEEFIHTQEEAAQYFKEQNETTHLPYVYLSGGVSSQLFNKTLEFARNSGAYFNGVLCGRATWKGATDELVEKGESAARKWLENQGVANLQALNEVNQQFATSIH